MGVAVRDESVAGGGAWAGPRSKNPASPDVGWHLRGSDMLDPPLHRSPPNSMQGSIIGGSEAVEKVRTVPIFAAWTKIRDARSTGHPREGEG